MSKERVLVVGAGGISNAWFPPIVAEQLEVVGVVDLNPDAARKQVEKYALPNAAIYSDLDAALREAKADFALDLTIPDAHFEVTTKCLEAGLHVMGEKPMAATLEQARQMIATSERTGRMFMTSQSRRWDKKHASIAATLRSGRLGRITGLYCDFFIGAHFGGFREQMESVLILDMAIHHFDLARMFVGGDASDVWCEEFNPPGSWYSHDAAADAVFTMGDGIRFNYRGSWAAEGAHTSWNGDWRIVGTEGTLLYAGDADPHGSVVDQAAPAGFHRPLLPLSIERVEMEASGMHGALREMLRFLRTGERPQTECHDNIRSLAMVHAAMESSRSGTRVRVS